MPEKERLEIPNIALSCLLEEIRPFAEGAFVEKAQDMEKKGFKLKIRSKNGSLDLVFLPNCVLSAQYKASARQQSSGFGAFARKRIEGKKIQSIKQPGLERIAKFDFGEFSLIAELFGKGNLLFLDSSGKILKPLKKESWSSRTLKTGEKYSMPPSRGKSPLELSPAWLKSRFGKSEKDIVRALLEHVNIPPVIAEEALARAGIDKTKKAKMMKESGAKKVCSALKRLYSKPCGKKAFLAGHSGKKALLPFEPKLGLPALAEFESVNSALNELFLLPFLRPVRENKKLARLKRSLEGQKDALEMCELGEKENREKAEFIYSNYPALMEAVSILRETKGKNDIMYKKPFGGVFLKRVDFKKKKAVFEAKKG